MPVPCMNVYTQKIADNLLELGDPVEMPVQHDFSEGVYARQITLKAGTVLVGAVHTTRYLNVVQSGLVTIMTPYRKFTVAGPCTFESFEGEQKIGIVHEDCVWTTIHPTTETDPDKIVEAMTASTLSEVEALQVLSDVKRLGESK